MSIALIMQFLNASLERIGFTCLFTSLLEMLDNIKWIIREFCFLSPTGKHEMSRTKKTPLAITYLRVFFMQNKKIRFYKLCHTSILFSNIDSEAIRIVYENTIINQDIYIFFPLVFRPNT